MTEASIAPATKPRRSRALDWGCAFLMLSLGVTFALPGDSLSGSAYDSILNRHSENAWAAICLATAAVRIAALIINGRLYEGSPLLRSASGAIGAFVWGQFAVLFLGISLRAGILSPGIGVNLVLCLCEIYSCARAGADLIHARRARVEP